MNKHSKIQLKFHASRETITDAFSQTPTN